MPAFRPLAAPPDREGAAAALSAALAGPTRTGPASTGQLISEAGGTRRAAELLGVSSRTVQRRAAQQGRALSDTERQTLERAVARTQIQRAVHELGGVKRVAELTGRSPSTVRRWASGRIRAPKADAQRILTRPQTARRMRTAGLRVDPATGRPSGPVTLQMTADVRIKGESKSPSYDQRTKNIGAQFPVTIDDQAMTAVVDAVGAGDRAQVQQVLEEYLSTNYAACSSYDPDSGIGLFIDRIEHIEFNQQNPDARSGPPGGRD